MKVLIKDDGMYYYKSFRDEAELQEYMDVLNEIYEERFEEWKKEEHQLGEFFGVRAPQYEEVE